LRGHPLRFAHDPGVGKDDKNLSHRGDEPAQRSCRAARSGGKRCALAVDWIWLLPGVGSFRSTVHQPHKGRYCIRPQIRSCSGSSCIANISFGLCRTCLSGSHECLPPGAGNSGAFSCLRRYISDSIEPIRILDAGNHFFAARLYGSLITCLQLLYCLTASFWMPGVNSDGSQGR
jgi:hypothetical protein